MKDSGFYELHSIAVGGYGARLEILKGKFSGISILSCDYNPTKSLISTHDEKKIIKHVHEKNKKKVLEVYNLITKS